MLLQVCKIIIYAYLFWGSLRFTAFGGSATFELLSESFDCDNDLVTGVWARVDLADVSLVLCIEIAWAIGCSVPFCNI